MHHLGFSDCGGCGTRSAGGDTTERKRFNAENTEFAENAEGEKDKEGPAAGTERAGRFLAGRQIPAVSETARTRDAIFILAMTR